MSDIFTASGILAKNLPEYEVRQGQQEKFVYRAKSEFFASHRAELATVDIIDGRHEEK